MASKEPEEKYSNTKTGEETMALEKRRSKSRRVSFAETTAIHLFIRDEECETPPEVEDANNGWLHRTASDEIRNLLADDDDCGGASGGGDDDDDDDGVAVATSFLRPLESPSPGSYFGSATSNDEDNFFGPVSADFIKPGRLSDSAASDENHDVTMDSTAFSMHFRSLARSDSGGEFKTPTGVRLAFGERTSGQMSTTTSGDLMIMSASRNQVSGSLLVDTVTDSGYSDDMSVVGENHRKYDYGKLPPELDVLLADDDKDVGAVSLNSQVSNSKISFKVDAGSGLQQNGFELLDINNEDKYPHSFSDVKKTSDSANSAIQVNIDNENDGVPRATLGETAQDTSNNMDDDLFPVVLTDDHTKNPIIPTNGMPADKHEEAMEGAVGASRKFLSYLSSSHSNLNYELPIEGSVSSMLAKRRQIFKVSPNENSNLIVSEKKLSEKGSRQVFSASSSEKGVSRLKRLEAFPFLSASKAEGNASRLKPTESVTSSLTRNYVLKYGSKDILIDHLAAPVACLDKQFSNVAEDYTELQSMGKLGRHNMSTTLGDAQCSIDTEAKDVELSSLYGTLCTQDNSRKRTCISVSPLALANEKRLEPFLSRDCHSKEIVLPTRSDCSLLEITFNDLKNDKEAGIPNYSAFSPETSAERKVSASPLYQGSLSKNLNQQAEFNLRLDQDIMQMETGDLTSGYESSSSLLIKRKEEAKRSSSNTKNSETVPQKMQNDESMCFQAASIDKPSESCKLEIKSANAEGGTMSTRALPVKDTKSFNGSAPTSENNLTELPIQESENSREELSCSLLQKKPCLADDAIVGITVLTPGSYQLISKHDENDRPLLKSLPLYGSSSSLKRKLFDKSEHDKDEIASFQHKAKLCKENRHFEGDSKVPHCVGGDTTARDWVDVLSSFQGMTELFPSSVGKLDLAQIRMLNDILIHLDKMRSYELLHRDICSQKTFDSGSFLQIKRLVDTKLLLYKTLYQKAKLQLMHLERDRLLDQVRQLDSRVEESKFLILSCHGSCVRGQKHVEIDCLPPVSCPIDFSSRSMVAAEIPSLRKELEVSAKEIRNLNKSCHAYIKVVNELTCTETSRYVENFLRKRGACQSLQSGSQLCQVGSIKTMDGKLNILFDYGGIMSQRFIVRSISTYGLFVSNELDNAKISKMFLGMDACIAFSFVLCGETNHAYSGIQTISQETQRSSSLLHTLLDVVEEVELAMIELRNLTDCRFSQPSAGKLDLRLCFTEFNSCARVALSMDITCLNRGIYPAQVMPYEVQGKAARRHKSFQLLLDNVKSAVQGVRCGHMRILNLCRCVSRTIQANCMS